MRKKITLANIQIVTHDELALAIGKKFGDCTMQEKEDLHRRFIVVPTKDGTIYESASRLRSEAKEDVVRILARMLFTGMLVVNLDLGLDWSWWIVFLPIWGMAFCMVGSAFRNFAETQAAAVKRDPVTFGLPHAPGIDEEQQVPSGEASSAYVTMDESKKNAAEEQPEPLTDDERDELKAKVMHSAYRAVGTCFSQCFFLLLICLLIGKIEGKNHQGILTETNQIDFTSNLISP